MKTRHGNCLLCELKVLLNILEYQKFTYMLTSVIKQIVCPGISRFQESQETKDFIKYFRVNHASVPTGMFLLIRHKRKRQVGLLYQNRCLWLLPFHTFCTKLTHWGLLSLSSQLCRDCKDFRVQIIQKQVFSFSLVLKKLVQKSSFYMSEL